MCSLSILHISRFEKFYDDLLLRLSRFHKTIVKISKVLFSSAAWLNLADYSCNDTLVLSVLLKHQHECLTQVVDDWIGAYVAHPREAKSKFQWHFRTGKHVLQLLTVNRYPPKCSSQTLSLSVIPFFLILLPTLLIHSKRFPLIHTMFVFFFL